MANETCCTNNMTTNTTSSPLLPMMGEAQDDFVNYWFNSTESHIHDSIKNYLPPILVVVGSIGNTLVFVVLMRRLKCQASIYFYMSMFVLANTLVLNIGCGLDWLLFLLQQPHVAVWADWICRLWTFVFDIILYFPHWLVVAMTVDRYIILWYPSKANGLCSVFAGKLATIFILIGLTVVSIHAMWTFALIPDPAHPSCVIDPAQHSFQTMVWPWVSAALHVYVPLVLNFVFSMLITVGIFQPQARNRTAQQEQLTSCTLLVSLTYLLFSLPRLIVNMLEYSASSRSHSYVAQLILARAICHVITCFNNSITFLLYLVTLPGLRGETTAMFRRTSNTPHPTTHPQELQALDNSGGGEIMKIQSASDNELTIL